MMAGVAKLRQAPRPATQRQGAFGFLVAGLYSVPRKLQSL